MDSINSRPSWYKADIANRKWNSESRMRENRLSGLMRGGKQTVIGRTASHPVASCLLYTGVGKRDEFGRCPEAFALSTLERFIT